MRYSSLSLVRAALPRQSRWKRHIPFALFLLALAGLVLIGRLDSAQPVIGIGYEFNAIAAVVGRSGAYALNTSYEWCCTCGVGDDPDGGVRLLRVLEENKVRVVGS